MSAVALLVGAPLSKKSIGQTLQKFFIVGCPRSGTTLVQQALNRHSHVAIPPETAYFTFVGCSKRIQQEHLGRLNEDLGIDLPYPKTRICRPSEARTFFEKLAEDYVKRCGKSQATHFGEKSPAHLSRLGRIEAVVPEGKVIIIYRDGRDVALSLPSLPWTSKDLYVNFGLWLYCVRLQKRAQRTCKLPLLCVRYEDIVREPDKEFRRILDFLGLQYESQVVDGEGNVDGVPAWEYDWKHRATSKITAERSGAWREKLSPYERMILERWGGDALRELGYELVTKGDGHIPWSFYARVAWNSLYWFWGRPRYAQAKYLWLHRNNLRTKIQAHTDGCLT